MSGIKRIMAAIAFSKYSQSILEYSANMASDLNAELVVAHVINVKYVEAISSVESMGYNVNTSEFLENLKKERTEELKGLMKNINFPDERLRAVFKTGNPFAKLLDLIQSEGVDLVIMGAKGLSDLQHILLGSVTEKIIRHSPVPVLVYRR